MSLYAVKSADGFAGITVKSTESLATELMVASSEKKKSTTTRKESEMTSENETVADNVSARHQFRDAAKIIPHEEVAVSKMETTTQTSEKSSAVCNEAAMREALVAMVEAETCGTMERDYLCGRCLERMFDRCKHDGSCWVDKVMNALAESKGEAE